MKPDVKGYHVSPPKSDPVHEVVEQKPVKKPTPPPPPVDEDEDDSIGWMNEED
jgi:hypothetical protein